MKEIKAFIRPNKVNDIVHHLKDAGFENMTISSAEGTGKLQDEAAFVSQKFSITDSEVAKLELVVNKNDVDKVVHYYFGAGQNLKSRRWYYLCFGCKSNLPGERWFEKWKLIR